jgi:hypothetical protein
VNPLRCSAVSRRSETTPRRQRQTALYLFLLSLKKKTHAYAQGTPRGGARDWCAGLFSLSRCAVNSHDRRTGWFDRVKMDLEDKGNARKSRVLLASICILRRRLGGAHGSRFAIASIASRGIEREGALAVLLKLVKISWSVQSQSLRGFVAPILSLLLRGLEDRVLRSVRASASASAGGIIARGPEG